MFSYIGDDDDDDVSDNNADDFFRQNLGGGKDTTSSLRSPLLKTKPNCLMKTSCDWFRNVVLHSISPHDNSLRGCGWFGFITQFGLVF